MYLTHPRELIEGRFIARYDRFIAVVEVAGNEIEAHCVNPGRMEGLIHPACRAWVSKVPEDSKRKLRYTLELLEIDGVMIGVNTLIPNTLAEAIIRSGLIPGMQRFRELRREVPYGERSRIDLLLTLGSRRHYIEVKNCHLVYPDGGAYFPDSVSVRATTHLEELVRVVRDGDKASVLFVVQRDDARVLRPSQLHDSAFAEAARKARAAGVVFRAAYFAPDPGGFRFLGMIPVDLKPYKSHTLAAYREALSSSSGWLRRGRRSPQN
jgi:sugar fermentation stimulation protein A